MAVHIGGRGPGHLARAAAIRIPPSILGTSLAAWFDPSDLGTVWQDTAQTTPGEAGSPVARETYKNNPALYREQATLAHRPILRRMPASGVRNLLTYTEDFSNAVWSKLNGGVASGKLLTFTNNNSYFQQNISGTFAVGSVFTLKFKASVASGSQPLRTTIADSADGSPTSNQQNTITSTPTYFTHTVTLGAGFGGAVAILFVGNSAIAPGTVVTIEDVQFELGSTATAYQKVVSRHDVTEAGVPSKYVLRSDFVDDKITWTPPSAGQHWINTPYGHMVAEAQAVSSYSPLNDATQEVLSSTTLTASQEAALGRYFGTDRKISIMLSNDTTFVNLRFYTGGSSNDVVFVGANGVSVTKVFSANSDSTYDVSADGLTAPVAVVFPVNDDLALFLFGDNSLTGCMPSLSNNTALNHFYCQGNQLTGSIPSLSNNTALSTFYCYSNQLTGSIPSLSNNTALISFLCYSNQLTGSIPSLSNNTALSNFYCYSNQLTGSIPSLSNNTALSNFYCYSNQLTGSIPSLSNNTALVYFYCNSNQLTGSIPALNNNVTLNQFICNNNQLTGSIPSLSNNTSLVYFYCHENQLTDWAGGGVSATLGNFNASNNILTQAAVDAILAAFVAAGRTTGTRVLNVGGTGNAAPSATGLTDKATLISRGWTVTTN